MATVTKSERLKDTIEVGTVAPLLGKNVSHYLTLAKEERSAILKGVAEFGEPKYNERKKWEMSRYSRDEVARLILRFKDVVSHPRLIESGVIYALNNLDRIPYEERIKGVKIDVGGGETLPFSYNMSIITQDFVPRNKERQEYPIGENDKKYQLDKTQIERLAYYSMEFFFSRPREVTSTYTTATFTKKVHGVQDSLATGVKSKCVQDNIRDALSLRDVEIVVGVKAITIKMGNKPTIFWVREDK